MPSKWLCTYTDQKERPSAYTEGSRLPPRENTDDNDGGAPRRGGKGGTPSVFSRADSRLLRGISTERTRSVPCLLWCICRPPQGTSTCLLCWRGSSSFRARSGHLKSLLGADCRKVCVRAGCWEAVARDKDGGSVREERGKDVNDVLMITSLRVFCIPHFVTRVKRGTGTGTQLQERERKRRQDNQ